MCERALHAETTDNPILVSNTGETLGEETSVLTDISNKGDRFDLGDAMVNHQAKVGTVTAGEKIGERAEWSAVPLAEQFQEGPEDCTSLSKTLSRTSSLLREVQQLTEEHERDNEDEDKELEKEDEDLETRLDKNNENPSYETFEGRCGDEALVLQGRATDNAIENENTPWFESDKENNPRTNTENDKTLTKTCETDEGEMTYAVLGNTPLIKVEPKDTEETPSLSFPQAAAPQIIVQLPDMGAGQITSKFDGTERANPNNGHDVSELMSPSRDLGEEQSQANSSMSTTITNSMHTMQHQNITVAIANRCQDSCTPKAVHVDGLRESSDERGIGQRNGNGDQQKYPQG